jgi:CheY-like chemotaxis protein
LAANDSQLRIVLIDDNPDHARILQWAFGKSGRTDQFTCFEDGHTALEYLSASHSHSGDAPDVIFLDFNLPRIDGREVLRRLKEGELTRSIPVIVLSSSERDEDIRRAYELGASSYFSKSVIFDDLNSVLQTIQQFWSHQTTKPLRK